MTALTLPHCSDIRQWGTSTIPSNAKYVLQNLPITFISFYKITGSHAARNVNYALGFSKISLNSFEVGKDDETTGAHTVDWFAIGE